MDYSQILTDKPLIPEFLETREISYGIGLFTKVAFKEGEIIFESICIPMKEEEVLKYLTPEQKVMNTVKQLDDGFYYMYGFDRYINHSCEPNSYEKFISADVKGNVRIQQIALRDINVGEEINSDYHKFEYDCVDKKIDPCCCGTACCAGKILGFKYLSFEEKLKYLPYVNDSVINSFQNDYPNFLVVDTRTTPTKHSRIQIVTIKFQVILIIL